MALKYKYHLGKITSNRALRSLLLGNSIILVSLAMFVPVFALFVQKLGGGALSAGITVGALGICSGISALVSGKIVDKLPRERTRDIVGCGWVLISLVTIMYLFIHSVTALLVIQIIAGFIHTISAPAFDTLYARHLDNTEAGQEYGIWEASFFLTGGVGAIFGGIIVNYFGFNGLFITMSVLELFAAIYILTLPKKVFN